jgi:hypothetical protein
MKDNYELTSDKTETEVAEMIAREADVKRVVECEGIGGGRFRYLIETPFQTLPRFVIGSTDAALSRIRIALRCGAEWNAIAQWQKGVGR